MYLFLDCEMGGIGREYSLLSAYFAVLDAKFEPIDELELFVQPNDGIYHVCGPAMAVNKINLIDHDRIAMTYKLAGASLYTFLKQHSGDGSIKLVPCGHGIKGDIDVIVEHLMSRGSFEKFTSYRVLDTSSVAQFLRAFGMFPEEVSGSLESLAKHFNILNKFDETKLHTARTDTLVTVEVLKSLGAILKTKQ
jgi:oligoribonuclease (3'-5' exoribonuclease)